VEIDVRRNFLKSLQRLALATFGTLALSASIMPLAGAAEDPASVSITTPSDGVTYTPRTWVPGVLGTTTPGPDGIDYVEVQLYDSTSSLYYDGLNWVSSAATIPTSGTDTWSTTIYATALPIDHNFTMKAIATTLAPSTVESTTINFSYASGVGTFSCNSNPNLFNTGFNANNGGYLSDYSADSYWSVTGPSLTSGAGLPPTGATWTSASVNNLIPSQWFATPYYNSQWISQQNADQPYQVPQNDPGDWWYRYQFNLSVTDPTSFQIPFNWYSDNNIWEIYVNGVAQSPTSTGLPQNPDPTAPYENLGFYASGASNATLHGPFVNGLNTILVQIKSDNDYEGFNAVFRPSSVCPVDLSVTKTASQSSYVAGQALSYTVTVSNAGPGTAYNVGLSDTLPAGLPTTGANAFTWSCSKVDNDSRCSSGGDTTGSGNINETIYRIAPGGSVQYVVTGTIPAGTHSKLSNKATVTPAADSVDPGCSPTCSSKVDILQAITDLSVTKTASPSRYVTGGSLTYTITVSNAGPNTATNATVTDNLPVALAGHGFLWTCVATSGGTCTASGSGDISDTVTIPAGGKVTYTLTGTVPSGATGDIVNTATATPPPGVSDPHCTPNCKASVKTQAVVASINITTVATPQGKTVNGALSLGGKIKYTFIVKNTGSTTLDNVAVTSPLTGVVCPKKVLAPGEQMLCTASSLYTVVERDVVRGHVDNEATANGLDHATPVTNNSNKVSTPIIPFIPTDLGTPDGLPPHGMNTLSLLGLIGLMSVGLGLLFRRRHNN
jgi:uncharacterized repeat protein (TIGR01451 family)/LPXTG-motif cell wall-anchored protein